MTIPDYIVKNQNLSACEKLLYGLIVTYQDNGICEKSNEFFASKLNIGVRSIQRYINHMCKLGHVSLQNYGKVKNAIFITNNKDWFSSIASIENTVSKILDNSFGDISVASNDKIVATNDKFVQNGQKCRQNNVYVSNSLDSKQENINNNNCACARVRDCVDNLTIFSSYEILNNTIKAPAHTQKERAPYLYLFNNVYLHNEAIKPYIDEIVDTIIEADNQSHLATGLNFKCVHYGKLNPFSDILLNITDKEMQSILENVFNKYNEIKCRPAYILSAVINAGMTINSKKVWDLVGKGAPWCKFTPRNKYLSSLVAEAQNYYEHQKQNLILQAEYEKRAMKGN